MSPHTKGIGDIRVDTRLVPARFSFCEIRVP